MKLIQIFYDGKCGLCSKEINYYKKVSPKNIFKWNDIANNPKELKQIGVSQYDALMYLHALDKNKNPKIGVDAFIYYASLGLDMERQKRSLRLFIDQVLPAFTEVKEFTHVD